MSSYKEIVTKAVVGKGKKFLFITLKIIDKNSIKNTTGLVYLALNFKELFNII